MSPGSLAAIAALHVWFQTQGLPPPDRDPRLDDAAAIAADRASEGAAAEADLRFALRRAGVLDADIVSLQLNVGGDGIGPALDRMRHRVRSATHWGIGGRIPTVLLARRLVHFEMPPPLQALGDELELRGALVDGAKVAGAKVAGAKSLTALYQTPKGEIREAPVHLSTTSAGFVCRIPLRSGPGRYRVEFLVEGPTVAALFSVWSEMEAPSVPEVAVTPRFTSLTVSLDQARSLAGAPRLRRLDALDAVALSHSADMALRGYFSHRSLDGRSPLERVAQAGVGARRVLENIASAHSPAAAHAQVLESPGHLRNLLDATVNAFGIGVYEHQGVHYVTWLFAEVRTSSATGRARMTGRGSPTP